VRILSPCMLNPSACRMQLAACVDPTLCWQPVPFSHFMLHDRMTSVLKHRWLNVLCSVTCHFLQEEDIDIQFIAGQSFASDFIIEHDPQSSIRQTGVQFGFPKVVQVRFGLSTCLSCPNDSQLGSAKPVDSRSNVGRRLLKSSLTSTSPCNLYCE